MASLSLCLQFETNLRSNRKIIEILLQLKSAKAHGKIYKKSNHTCSIIFCIIFYPGGTLELFDKYVQSIKLIFELTFQKADGTPYEPSDKKKKAILLFRGGDDMKDLFEHVSAVTDTDTFDAVVTKIRTGLQGHTSNVVQKNLRTIRRELKYVLKICGLNFEIVSVTRPCIRFFSFI